jgi:hypothetical protein
MSDDLLDRLLYVVTALALLGVFGSSETFLSQLSAFGATISKAVF